MAVAVAKKPLQTNTEVDMYPTDDLTLSGHITKVTQEEKDKGLVIRPEHYGVYFNYDLKPQTWNLLVNKQIFMRFEKLLIEK